MTKGWIIDRTNEMPEVAFEDEFTDQEVKQANIKCYIVKSAYLLTAQQSVQIINAFTEEST